jgi:hypothetical protein
VRFMFQENEFYALRVLNCVATFVHCILAMLSGSAQILSCGLDLYI